MDNQTRNALIAWACWRVSVSLPKQPDASWYATMQNMSGDERERLLAELYAEATQPAPASVEDAMRARGWEWPGIYQKDIGGTLYYIEDVGAGMWSAYIPGVEVENDEHVGLYKSALAAADACERHAAQEQGK